MTIQISQQEEPLEYQLIENQGELADFCDLHEQVDWMAFDTEFISEKRYYPQLCLIQVASEHGYFLIDTMVVDDLSGFLKMITNEAIVKITHAGNNDYRLFNLLYQITPKNVFDVQLAAGFVGYRFPLALDSLLSGELNVKINKSQKVSDWSERPMRRAQIKYALIDIVYLKRLADQITLKLDALQRRDYALEEMRDLEDHAYYQTDLIKSVVRSTSLMSLPKRNQLFFIRMHQWREQEAKRRDVTKNMVLDNKALSDMAKTVQYGLENLRSNRRLPKGVVFKRGEMLMSFYDEPANEFEEQLLKMLPKRPKHQPEIDLIFDQIDLYIRYIGQQSGVNASLLLPRAELNKMKADAHYMPDVLQKEWRRRLLGEDIFEWFKKRKPLTMAFEMGKMIVSQ